LEDHSLVFDFWRGNRELAQVLTSRRSCYQSHAAQIIRTFRKGKELEAAWLHIYGDHSVRVCQHDGNARLARNLKITLEMMGPGLERPYSGQLCDCEKSL
jgi:hypothetical protein